MGDTRRYGCDYSGKPNPRISRADIAGASRAVEENILSALREVVIPLRHELSLDPEVNASLHDRFLGKLQSLGEQATAQEVEFVA
ncbi:MAG: hypothetical protein AAB914_03875 [Patescibacteria group bacterium]